MDTFNTRRSTRRRSTRRQWKTRSKMGMIFRRKNERKTWPKQSYHHNHITTITSPQSHHITTIASHHITTITSHHHNHITTITSPQSHHITTITSHHHNHITSHHHNHITSPQSHHHNHITTIISPRISFHFWGRKKRERGLSFTGQDDLLWRLRSFTGKDDLLLWRREFYWEGRLVAVETRVLLDRATRCCGVLLGRTT